LVKPVLSISKFNDRTSPHGSCPVSDSRLLTNRTATAKKEQLARLAFRSGSVLAVGSYLSFKKEGYNEGHH